MGYTLTELDEWYAAAGYESAEAAVRAYVDREAPGTDAQAVERVVAAVLQEMQTGEPSVPRAYIAAVGYAAGWDEPEVPSWSDQADDAGVPLAGEIP